MYISDIAATIIHGGNKFSLSVPGLTECLSIQNDPTEMYDCCHNMSALTAGVFCILDMTYLQHLEHERGHQQNTHRVNSDIKKLMHAE